MYKPEALKNLNIPEEMKIELAKLIFKLKMSSRRVYENI